MVSSFESSVDPARDILQRSESDVVVTSKQVELEVKSITKPNINTISTTIERLIKEEIKTPIKTVITPREEPIYVPPIREEEIIYTAPPAGGGGSSGGGGGLGDTFIEIDTGNRLGRDRIFERNMNNIQ